jgi:hypothetical protein
MKNSKVSVNTIRAFNSTLKVPFIFFFLIFATDIIVRAEIYLNNVSVILICIIIHFSNVFFTGSGLSVIIPQIK